MFIGSQNRSDLLLIRNLLLSARKLTEEEWSQIRRIILEGWQSGKSNLEIAKGLGFRQKEDTRQIREGVASGTIRGYVKRIYFEAGVHTQPAALFRAYQMEWIPCPCTQKASHSSIEVSDKITPYRFTSTPIPAIHG
jgi:hypothetical protein